MKHHAPTKPDTTKILFLDIETVTAKATFGQLDERTQELWSKKAKSLRRHPDHELMSDAELYEEKAGIYAEFAKVIVISVGRVDDEGVVHLNSYSSDDEMEVLSEFAQLLDKHYTGHKHYLCGHNAKEFDIPFLCRRMLVHGLTLPKIMPHAGQKPRDTKILDTMEMWKFGDRKAYTSLDVLCNIFMIESPKGDISGSDVSRVYWEGNGLQRITEYCERDVEALIKVYGRVG